METQLRTQLYVLNLCQIYIQHFLRWSFPGERIMVSRECKSHKATEGNRGVLLQLNQSNYCHHAVYNDLFRERMVICVQFLLVEEFHVHQRQQQRIFTPTAKMVIKTTLFWCMLYTFL
jgi:hypothetical protein